MDRPTSASTTCLFDRDQDCPTVAFVQVLAVFQTIQQSPGVALAYDPLAAELAGRTEDHPAVAVEVLGEAAAGRGRLIRF
jgi:hypothetical protein